MYLISDVLKWRKDEYGWSVNPDSKVIKIKIGDWAKIDKAELAVKLLSVDETVKKM